jgi:hypothetical protein
VTQSQKKNFVADKGMCMGSRRIRLNISREFFSFCQDGFIEREREKKFQ